MYTQNASIYECLYICARSLYREQQHQEQYFSWPNCLPKVLGSQTLLYNIARHLDYHTCADTHRKNHIPATSCCVKGVTASAHAILAPAHWLGLQQTRHYLCNLPAFMIAAQQCHVSWISGFQEHEQGKGLQAVVASVDKVTHEDVVCLGHFLPGCK